MCVLAVDTFVHARSTLGCTFRLTLLIELEWYHTSSLTQTGLVRFTERVCRLQERYGRGTGAT